MARKAKKTSVAHARAFRHKKHYPAEPNDAQPAVHDDDDVENECDYEGGVNCYWSEDSDYAPDSDSEWSDGDESVVEFEGEELEQNLTALRAEVEALRYLTKYEEVSAASKMTMKDWRKVESNRALGYTGNSIRTAQRNAKAVRDREMERIAAKKS
ncbi:hypothetical protein F4604DRAFT_1760712 [Suillus subluteus]|nr:hypothetical protein F4604DRAFT_1760712 [Suillus subluteus]